MKAFNTQQCGRKVLVITDSDLLQVVGMREGTQIWSCAKFSFLQSCQFTLETGSLSRVRGLSCERENLEPLRSCCCPPHLPAPLAAWSSEVRVALQVPGHFTEKSAQSQLLPGLCALQDS